MDITQSFLMQNPHIKQMLNNDRSLRYICPINELRQIDFTNRPLPQLFYDSDIAYNMNDFSIENYIKMFLCMVVNNRLELTLNYTNCNCSQEEVTHLLEIMKKAFEVARAKYIEYLSGILGIELQSQVKLMGNVVIAINIFIKLEEHYHGALRDTFVLVKMCEYISQSLIYNRKIHKKMSEYEIAQVLFNWVVLHVDYDIKCSKYSYTGYSAAAYGYAVCQGFTALYNCLCKWFHLNVVGMSGKARSKFFDQEESHIWTFALINNRNTYIDVTWGKPKFEHEYKLKSYGIDTKELCDFDYFDIPKNVLKRDHSWDKTLYGD